MRQVSAESHLGLADELPDRSSPRYKCKRSPPKNTVMFSANTDVRADKGLSVREESVLSLSCAGLNDKEIASRLSISVETVRTYWARIKAKFEVETRAEAVVAAASLDVSNLMRAQETENLALFEEIQRRRNAERLLAESEARFQFFCESASQGLFMADTEGRCHFINSQCLEAIGMDREQVVGTRWRDLPWHPTMLRALRRGLVKLRRTGACTGTYSLRSGGRDRQLRISIREVRREFGAAGYTGTVEDVSESVELRKKIEAARQFCECVAAATNDIVYIMEIATRQILYVNHASESLFGIGADQMRMMGSEAQEQLVDPAERSQVAERHLAYLDLADGEFLPVECRVLAANGTRPLLRGRVTVYKRDEFGVPTKVLGVLRIVRDDSVAEVGTETVPSPNQN